MAAQYKAQLAQMSTSAQGSHRDLADKYKAVLGSILLLGEDELVDSLKAFIEAIVNENVSLVISRELLSKLEMMEYSSDFFNVHLEVVNLHFPISF